MSIRILVTESMSDIGPEWLREQGVEIRYGRGIDSQTLIEDLQGCQGVIARLAELSAEVLEHTPDLKVIARHGAGVDSVDMDFCKSHGITVLRNVGTNSVAVAEYAVMLMLVCAKQLSSATRMYKDGDFNEARKSIKSYELNGKTLGLIGIGNVGRNVAKICSQGFGMKVLAFDPYTQKDQLPEWITITDDRKEVFRNADFVSVHVPATNETKNSIGESEFKLMKPGAYFINTSRGVVVDENALIEALNNGIIAGAGLDVTQLEPAELTNPLFQMSNVVLTPHCAGSSKEAKDKASMAAAKGCYAVLTGEPVEAPAVIV